MAKTDGSSLTKTNKDDKSVHPPVNKLPMQGAKNMAKPGSDNESHHPNGHHAATNCKTGDC